jgi:hypothetical protein
MSAFEEIEVVKSALPEGASTSANQIIKQPRFIVDETTGTAMAVNETGQAHVVMRGEVDSNNTTTSLLGAGATYTGTATDVLDYAVLFVNCHSDEASAIDGLSIQQSIDGSDWTFTDEYTIQAGGAKTFSFQLSCKYFRVVYTNGANPQTHFDLSSTLKKTNSKPSSHRIQDSISDEDDAELVKSVLTALKPNGDFININATNNDNLRVSIAEYSDTPATDAFARLRVSNPFTLFDSKQLHDKQPLFWDEELGGSATSTHIPTDACTAMTVTASASDYVIRQTKQRMNYQPGKSQLVFMTFHSEQVAGLTKRVGYFDGTGTNNLTPNNGIFYETNGDISWNICKNGTTVETVTQANWNIDRLDGTGASGITLDTSSAQILLFDFQWLGVGRVRVGFEIDGLVFYVHHFNHANDPAFTSIYMSSPNLPLRYSIESDGTTGGTLDHICGTVISEGGVEKTGILRSVDNGVTKVTLPLKDVTYIMKAIRLKDAYKDVTVIPESFSLLNSDKGDFKWSLHVNPTYNGTLTFVDVANSSIQEASGTGAQDLTDPGVQINSGYISDKTREAGEPIETSQRIGSNIDGTTDILALCATPEDNAKKFLGSLGIRELI